MTQAPGKHRYLIRLQHVDSELIEEIEMEALGPEMALSELERTPHRGPAVIFEDGDQIAELEFFEGFWRVE